VSLFGVANRLPRISYLTRLRSGGRGSVVWLGDGDHHEFLDSGDVPGIAHPL